MLLALACGALGCHVLAGLSDLDAEQDGSATGATTGGPMGASIGAACTSATDCQSTLICVPEDRPVEGPAGGVCTMACTGGECPSGTQCVSTPTGGLCLETCTYGDSLESKCHGRRDVGCTPGPALGMPQDACVPVCSDDDDCAVSDRRCNRRTGLCTNAPAIDSALPVAAPCTATPALCRGFCDGQTCQEQCVFGAPNSCRGNGVEAECYFAYLSMVGTGDLGACARRCNGDMDCGGVYACNQPDPTTPQFCGP